MIYYFSGTGNSEWVAKQLASGTGDIAVNMADLLRSGHTDISVDAGQNIGIVFPIYAWRAPELVVQFVKAIKIAQDVYRYAVCTCGDEAGLAMERFSTIFPVESAWSIIMPNNYIRLFNLDSKDVVRNKIEKAKERLPLICNAIRTKQKTWDVHEGPLSYFKTHVVNPLFNMAYLNAKGFNAESHCTACGLCVKKCPLGNITLKGDRPAWGNHCTQCMACIQHCPVQAIQQGNATKTKGRYFFREIE
jgi:ferredoxin